MFLAAAAFLLLLAPSATFAKGSGIGIYAVIDQVTFDQDGPSPNSVRISGVFMVPVPMFSGSFRSPERGYLYFRAAPGAEQAARKDWKQLKALAGTGEVVGFAFYWVPNPFDPGGNPHHSLEVTVHKDGEAATPEDYPLQFPDGVVKSGEQGVQFDPGAIAEFKKTSR